MRFTDSSRKMAKLFANSRDPDQTSRSVASDLWVCTVCQLPFYGSPDYNGLNRDNFLFFFFFHPTNLSCIKLQNLSISCISGTFYTQLSFPFKVIGYTWLIF